MRLRLLNLAYLSAAAVAVAWALFDMYSLLMPGGKNYPASSEEVISSALNIPILAGALFFLYVLYKFPESAGKRAHGKKRARRERREQTKQQDPVAAKSSFTPAQEMAPGEWKKVAVAAQVADRPENDENDNEPSLDEESTVLFSEGTTLDVEDYLEEELAAPIEAGQSTSDLPDSVMSDLDSEPLDPLIEAATLANFGQYDHAVNVLLEAFDRTGSNHDVFAMKIFEYIDEEMDKPQTSPERAAYLEIKKTEIISRLVTERAKLSSETWKTILPAKRARNTKPKDDDANDILLVNWH